MATADKDPIEAGIEAFDRRYRAESSPSIVWAVKLPREMKEAIDAVAIADSTSASNYVRNLIYEDLRKRKSAGAIAITERSA